MVEKRNKVSGIAYDSDVAKVTVRGVPDRPGIAASLFGPLSDAGISVDTIVQNASVEKITDLTFTVARNELEQKRDYQCRQQVMDEVCPYKERQ